MSSKSPPLPLDDTAPPLRILILEDIPQDAALLEARLRTINPAYTILIVNAELDFRRALVGFQPDLIISDYNVPAFHGLAALAVARQAARDTPFIFTSGSLGEECAITLLRQGASDLVLKHNLARLEPAIVRAMQEHEQRLKVRRTVGALRETIEVLHGTKHSFKSRALGELRQKLEDLVDATPWW